MQRRRERTRASLLAVGARQFAQRGIAPVSVEELIAEADVSRATFYAMFSSKYSLLEGILNPIFELATRRDSGAVLAAGRGSRRRARRRLLVALDDASRRAAADPARRPRDVQALRAPASSAARCAARPAARRRARGSAAQRQRAVLAESDRAYGRAAAARLRRPCRSGRAVSRCGARPAAASALDGRSLARGPLSPCCSRACLLAALDIAIVGPALPAIRDAFAVEPRWLPAVFSVYVLFYLIGTPLLAQALGSARAAAACFVESLALFGGRLAASRRRPGRSRCCCSGARSRRSAPAAYFPSRPPSSPRRCRSSGAAGCSGSSAPCSASRSCWARCSAGCCCGSSWRWLFVDQRARRARADGGVGARYSAVDACAAQPRRFDAAGAALLAVVLAALVVGVGQLDTGALAASLQSVRVWPCVGADRDRRAAAVVRREARRRSRAAAGVVPLAAAARRRRHRDRRRSRRGGHGVPAGHRRARLRRRSRDGEPDDAAARADLAVGAPLAGWLLDHDRPAHRRANRSDADGRRAAVVRAGCRSIGANFYLSGVLVGFGMSALLGAPLRYIALQEAGESRRGAGQGLLTLCVSIGQLVGAADGRRRRGLARRDALPGYRQSLLAVAAACAVALVLSAALRGRVMTRREPRRRSVTTAARVLERDVYA